MLATGVSGMDRYFTDYNTQRPVFIVLWYFCFHRYAMSKEEYTQTRATITKRTKGDETDAGGISNHCDQDTHWHHTKTTKENTTAKQ